MNGLTTLVNCISSLLSVIFSVLCVVIKCHILYCGVKHHQSSSVHGPESGVVGNVGSGVALPVARGNNKSPETERLVDFFDTFEYRNKQAVHALQ